MCGRGSDRVVGGTKITAILVSAGLHLFAAAIILAGRTETAPTLTPHTEAITLLPPTVATVEPAPPEEASPQPAAARAVAEQTPAPAVEHSRAAVAVPAITAVAVSAITPPPAPAPPPASSPPAEDAVRSDYTRRLWQWIAARRPEGMRIDGEAVVAFRVARDGRLSDIELAQPSGNKQLDRLALRTVRLSSPVPIPPDSLADETLRFTLTFHFR